jgi:hypothetical protein
MCRRACCSSSHPASSPLFSTLFVTAPSFRAFFFTGSVVCGKLKAAFPIGRKAEEECDSPGAIRLLSTESDPAIPALSAVAFRSFHLPALLPPCATKHGHGWRHGASAPPLLLRTTVSFPFVSSGMDVCRDQISGVRLLKLFLRAFSSMSAFFSIGKKRKKKPHAFSLRGERIPAHSPPAVTITLPRLHTSGRTEQQHQRVHGTIPSTKGTQIFLSILEIKAGRTRFFFFCLGGGPHREDRTISSPSSSCSQIDRLPTMIVVALASHSHLCHVPYPPTFLIAGAIRQ